jgi:hypothetical protein
MSRGLGRLQNEILAILNDKKENADYRRLTEEGKNRGLCYSRIPERWGMDEEELNRENPIEHGWVSVAILQALLGLTGRSSYKSLLYSLNTLEKKGLIQADLCYIKMVIGQQRKHVRLIGLR